MGNPHTNRLGVEWFGLAMGLGFVLSFGYWCTDFLVVQRAMAADSMAAARRVPLIAAMPKMLFPFLVVLPGLIALSVAPMGQVRLMAQIEQGSSPPARPAGIIPYKVHEGTNAIVVDRDGKPQ